jgi:ribosomal-protein-alanine N-acetyltransferase
MSIEIRSERLRLRRWKPADREPFAELNRDPVVMQFMPALLSREQSDALVQRIQAHFDAHGFGLLAVEIAADATFAGFIGLSIPAFEARFTPCVEIGWRLAVRHQGRGYATEGARAVLAFGFETLALAEIVSFTVPANVRSRRVMEKVGMRRSASGDFDHPSLPEGHALRRHVLYRLSQREWRARESERG